MSFHDKKGNFCKESKRNRIDNLLSNRKKQLEKIERENKLCSSSDSTYDENVNPASTKMSPATENSLRGRMIVEMDFIVRQLQTGCKVCDRPLNICNISKSTRHGLANVFSIPCANCTYVNRIFSSKTHYNMDKMQTRPIFDVNTKCAAGNFTVFLSITLYV